MEKVNIKLICRHVLFVLFWTLFWLDQRIKTGLSVLLVTSWGDLDRGERRHNRCLTAFDAVRGGWAIDFGRGVLRGFCLLYSSAPLPLVCLLSSHLISCLVYPPRISLLCSSLPLLSSALLFSSMLSSALLCPRFFLLLFSSLLFSSLLFSSLLFSPLLSPPLLSSVPLFSSALEHTICPVGLQRRGQLHRRRHGCRPVQMRGAQLRASGG